MEEIRCPNCSKLLFEAKMSNGTVKKKCSRCKKYITLTVEDGKKQIKESK